MSLTQTIANHFGVYLDYDKDWTPIRCPFHSDTNASAGLNFQERMFNCLGSCPAMPFDKLAEKLGIEYTDDEDEKSFDEWINEVIPSKPKPLTLLKQAEAFTNFLYDRQIKLETIEEFGGYYESRESEPDYGFLIVAYGKNKYVKRRIIGQGERFRNTPGDSKALFGRNINMYNTVILVEGITDYFTLWQQGFGNSKGIGLAATLGAKISEQQMYLLRNKKVFIPFDADYDGYKGARKASEYLKQFNAVPIIIEFPERFINEDAKIDINYLYVNHGDVFIRWLENEINKYNSYDNFYIRDVFNNSSNDEGKKLSQFSTGLHQVDAILNGGFASGIHGIAGRSGIGKSSLITELTCQAASYDKRVLSLSYELSKEQMWSRIASRYSQHNWSDIEKDKSILEPDVKKQLDIISQLVRIELGWNIDQILAAIDNFDVVIVDYLQRMEYEGNDRRVGILTNVSKMSNQARDRNKIIIGISSMAENQENFKESGDILYMCTSGWFLKKVSDNVTQFENIKNTRGISGKSVFLEMDFGHQRVKETTPSMDWIGG